MLVNGSTMLRKEHALYLSLRIQPAKADGQDTANHMLELWRLVAPSPIVSPLSPVVSLWRGAGTLAVVAVFREGLHSFSTKHPRDNTSPTLPLPATACTCLSAGSVGLGSGDS
jgi:hypothetical protein